MRCVGLCLIVALSQRPVDATLQAVDVEQLLTRFVATTEEYDKTFRNLVAEETKVLETFEASGHVDKRRQIVSDLLVYRSSRGATDATTEFRDVRSVDGKAVNRRGERAFKLLTDASKKDSLQKELETIKRETRKYEFNFHLQGFTISQPAGRWLKPPHEAYQVEVVGREEIAGHEVVVLNYRQTVPRPGWNRPGNLPKELGDVSGSLVRGRLWLDARTGQLWREIWEQGIAHPATSEFLTMFHREASYRPSEFGILIPERIVFDMLTRFGHPKNGPPLFTLTARTTFTYGAFKRFEVATDERVKLPGD